MRVCHSADADAGCVCVRETKAGALPSPLQDVVRKTDHFLGIYCETPLPESPPDGDASELGGSSVDAIFPNCCFLQDGGVWRNLPFPKAAC